MTAEGFDSFIEVGSGKVLSGLVRRIAGEVRVIHVQDRESLESTLTPWKGA